MYLCLIVYCNQVNLFSVFVFASSLFFAVSVCLSFLLTVKIKARRNSNLVSRGTRRQAASMAAPPGPRSIIKKRENEGLQRPVSFSHESPSHRARITPTASASHQALKNSTEAVSVDLASPSHSSLIQTYSTSPPPLNHTRADDTIVRSEGGTAMIGDKSEMTFDLGTAESDFSNPIDGTSTPVEGTEPQKEGSQDVVETVVTVVVDGSKKGGGEEGGLVACSS